MAFQNETEFRGTYLYKAFLAGILKHLDELTIGNVTIKGIDFNHDFISVKDLKLYNTYNICVAHCFYENERFGGTGNGNLTYDKCKELGYNAYVLGHDHTPYADVDEPLFKVIRPGSLTRGTSKTCNLYRKVNISLFDLDTHEFSLAEIPTKPGTEVFIEKVVLSKELDVNMDEIISNLDYSQHSDIYDIIDTHEESGKESLKEFYPEVISLITQYCESVGIYRKIDDNNEDKR